ncbi:MAG TPA: hypothetical protein VEK07_01620 [Polyangiaceae bacterium]|nr:hypothetical protein [Polyangiaceae bacterium]
MPAPSRLARTESTAPLGRIQHQGDHDLAFGALLAFDLERWERACGVICT